jgi:hypothetical protein
MPNGHHSHVTFLFLLVSILIKLLFGIATAVVVVV